eukprot:3532914-Rhodomonas_salina.1
MKNAANHQDSPWPENESGKGATLTPLALQGDAEEHPLPDAPTAGVGKEDVGKKVCHLQEAGVT